MRRLARRGAIVSAARTPAAGSSTGTIVQTLPALTQAVSGSSLTIVSGTAAQTLPTLTQTATGSFTAAAGSSSIVGSSTDKPTNFTGGDKPVTKPSGVSEGSLLIVGINYRNSNAAFTRSGWTELRLDRTGSTAISGAFQRIFTKVAGASEPSSWTFSNGDSNTSAFSWAVAVDGHDGVDVHGGTGLDVSSRVAPAVTTTTANCLLIHVWSGHQGGTTVNLTEPSGVSQVLKRRDTDEDWSNGVGFTIAEGTAASAGATSTRTATEAGSCTRHVSVTVAVAPA